MKKLIVIFAAGFMVAWAAQVSAFDLAVGARYSGLGDISKAAGQVSANSGLFQGEVLIGPLDLAAGYADLGNGYIVYPVTVGIVGKFPVSIVKPYIGADLSFLFDPNATRIPGFDLFIFTLQPKGGVEVQLGPVGVYGGIGYSFAGIYGTLAGLSYGGFVPVGLTWEFGGRFYITN